jgi:hypothetical protein
VAKAIAASVLLAAFTGAVGGFAYRQTSRDPIVTASSQNYVAAAECPDAICKSAKGQRGILIGDSHSDRLEDALVRETRKHGIALTRSAANGGDFAILNYRWNPVPEKYLGLDAQVQDLLQKGVKRILVIGPVPEFRYKAGICLFRAQRYGENWDRCSLPRAEVDAARRAAMAELHRAAAKYPAVRLIDPLDAFCDAKLCRPYENGATLYRDDNHVSVPYGADRLYFQFKEAFWWALGGAR